VGVVIERWDGRFEPGAASRGEQAPSTIREDEMSQEIHINVRFLAKPGKQAELSRRMLELRPDVEALGGTSIVTVDSEDETVLYFIETFPDQAALDADMKTPLVQALIADLGELTIHGTDFRIERSSPVAA
jgi:quinol monooxygenase YgiN